MTDLVSTLNPLVPAVGLPALQIFEHWAEIAKLYLNFDAAPNTPTPEPIQYLDAGGLRIINVGRAISPSDAATLDMVGSGGLAPSTLIYNAPIPDAEISEGELVFHRTTGSDDVWGTYRMGGSIYRRKVTEVIEIDLNAIAYSHPSLTGVATYKQAIDALALGAGEQITDLSQVPFSHSNFPTVENVAEFLDALADGAGEQVVDLNAIAYNHPSLGGVATAKQAIDALALGAGEQITDLSQVPFSHSNFPSVTNVAELLNVLAEGGAPTQVTLDTIPYSHPIYTNLATALDAVNQILFVPLSVTLSGGGTYERGQQVSPVTLSWSANKALTTQSLNQGIGTLSPTLRTYTHPVTITNDTTYTLTATADGETLTRSVSYSFRSRRYWGVSALPTLDDAGLRSLSSELATSRSKSFTVTPANQYIYYAYPSSWGTASFTINGLANTAWEEVVRSVVNAYGYTETYRILRSTFILNASLSVGVS